MTTIHTHRDGRYKEVNGATCIKAVCGLAGDWSVWDAEGNLVRFPVGGDIDAYMIKEASKLRAAITKAEGR